MRAAVTRSHVGTVAEQRREEAKCAVRGPEGAPLLRPRLDAARAP